MFSPGPDLVVELDGQRVGPGRFVEDSVDLDRGTGPVDLEAAPARVPPYAAGDPDGARAHRARGVRLALRRQGGPAGVRGEAEAELQWMT